MSDNYVNSLVISVADPRLRSGVGGKEFVGYEVSVQTNMVPPYPGESYTIVRRYTEFKEWYKHAAVQCRSTLPKFPKKKITKKKENMEVMEERRDVFDAMLRMAAMDPGFRRHPAMLAFLSKKPSTKNLVLGKAAHFEVDDMTMEEEHELLLQRVMKFQALVEDLEGKLAAPPDEGVVAELQSQVADGEASKAKVKELEAKLEELQHTLADRQLVLTLGEKETAKLQEKIEELEECVEQRDTKLAKFKMQAREYAVSKEREISALEDTIEEMQESLRDQTTASQATLHAAVASGTMASSSLEAELESTKTELEVERKRNVGLMEQNERRERELKDMGLAVVEAETERNRRQAHNKALAKQVDELESKLAASEMECRNLRDTVDKVSGVAMGKHQQGMQIAQQASAQNTQLLQRVKALEQEIFRKNEELRQAKLLQGR